MDTDDFVVFTFILGPAVAGLLFGATAVVMSASSSGKADYCYIKATQETNRVVYNVVAHRPWREDRWIGTGFSAQEANDVSNLLCR